MSYTSYQGIPVWACLKRSLASNVPPVGTMHKRFIPYVRVSSTYRYFLSFLLSFLDLSLPIHCRCRELLLNMITLNVAYALVRTPLDEGSARPPTSTWQHTTFTRDRDPCLRRDSNPQTQQASGRIRTPLAARPTGSAVWIHGDIPFSAFTCGYFKIWI